MISLIDQIALKREVPGKLSIEEGKGIEEGMAESST
jgi:hypothetical protein